MVLKKEKCIMVEFHKTDLDTWGDSKEWEKPCSVAK